MQKYIRFHPLHLAVTLTMALNSNIVQAGDLRSILEVAQDRDPIYLAARQQAKALEEKKYQARSALKPQVGLNANIAQNWQGNSAGQNGGGGADNQNSTYGANLTLTQAIYQPILRIGVEKAELQSDLAAIQLQGAWQDMAVRTVSAYLEVAQAQHVLTTYQDQKVASQGQVEAAKKRIELGTGNIFDLNDAQARTDSLEALELEAMNDLENKSRYFQRVLGIEIESVGSPSLDKALTPPSPNNVNEWINQAETRNPTVLIASIQKELAWKDVRMADKAHGPRVQFVARGGYEHTQFNQGATGMVGFEFNMPIMTGGALTSQGREAAALSGKAAQDYETIKRQTALQTLQAFNSLNTNVNQILSLQKALRSNRALVISAQEAFQAGARSIDNLMAALNLAYQAERDLGIALIRGLNNTIKLKAASGTLTPEDIAAISSFLE